MYSLSEQELKDCEDDAFYNDQYDQREKEEIEVEKTYEDRIDLLRLECYRVFHNNLVSSKLYNDKFTDSFLLSIERNFKDIEKEDLECELELARFRAYKELLKTEKYTWKEKRYI